MTMLLKTIWQQHIQQTGEEETSRQRADMQLHARPGEIKSWTKEVAMEAEAGGSIGEIFLERERTQQQLQNIETVTLLLQPERWKGTSQAKIQEKNVLGKRDNMHRNSEARTTCIQQAQMVSMANSIKHF